VEHRIPGLISQTINVFSATRQKLKPQTNMLRWGDSYYFIWRADKKLSIPPSMSPRLLAENGGWACAFVALPDLPDADASAWLAEVCDLRIARATREWSMIYPQPYAIDEDGNFKIVTGTKLQFVIKPAADTESQERELRVLCGSGQDGQSRTIVGP